MNQVESQAQAMLAWLREREDHMATLLAELVSIPSENPPGRNYRACVDLLERRCQEAGFASQRIPCEALRGSADEIPESLLVTYGNGPRAFYFHGHYDVVPAQSPEQFHPSRREHFLFGRGSCDMKGGIVSMFYAVAALREMNVPLNGRISLLLVPDEETGGQRGSVSLGKQGLLGRDAVGMLLPEPTSGVIWSANRGALSMRVRVFGKPAHVGLQHQGENAFERMHRVVEKLQQFKREVESRATRLQIGAGQLPNSILMIGGESAGGTNFNVVPAECWFTLDRRINPEENLAEERGALLRVLEDCKNEGIPLQWEIFQEAPSASCAEHEPLAQALSRNVRLVTGTAPRFEMCPGLLETRFYAAQGIPAYAYGPGLLSVAHGPNEYVDLRKVAEVAATYAMTAANVLNG